jgi:hypothetical protein
MAQKDPLVEYRHEGHLMFEQLGREIREEVVFFGASPLRIEGVDGSPVRAFAVEGGLPEAWDALRGT